MCWASFVGVGAPGEPVAAEVVVVAVVGEQVPADDQDRVADGDGGFAVSHASWRAASTGRRGRCRVVWRAAEAHSVRISPSHRLPLVVVPDRRLPPVMLLPGHIPAHDARCAAVGKRVMSTPISAMMHSAARLPTPVMVSSRSRAVTKGTITRSTSASSVGDGGFEVVDVVQDRPAASGVVVPEPAPQRFAELGDLLAQHALGQLGEHLGVAFTGDEGAQHQRGPTRPTRPRRPSRA